MKNQMQFYRSVQAIMLFFLAAFIFLSSTIRAQSVINGVIPDSSIHLVELFQMVEGKMVKVADYQVNKSREFAFAATIKKPGIVYIKDAVRVYSSTNPTDVPGNLNIRLFVKPDDVIMVQFDRHQLIISEACEQNKLLSEWYNISATVMNEVRAQNILSSGVLHIMISKAIAFKQKITTTDVLFNQQLLQLVNQDIDYASMYQYVQMHPVKFEPGKLQYFTHQKRFTDASILNLDDCKPVMKVFNQMVTVNDSLQHKKNFGNPGNTISLIQNDTLKGFYVTVMMDNIKDYDQFSKNVEPFKKYMVTPILLKRYEAIEKKLKGEGPMAIGKPAYDFSLEDVNGKLVTMNELRGKVVLVDAWATWCAPCKAQIPFLKQLEEEMKGRDIVFVSVSIDVPEAKAAWKAMIQKEQLGGIQLIDDNKKSFNNFYKLFTIPRFMIFDKEGKIVETNAPRPSEPALKGMLEKLLKANS